VAFLSQSGGMAIDLAHKGKWMGLKFSKVVSFGNGADLREVELLEYLADDPETGIIGIYVEGIKDGNAFFQAIKNAAGKNLLLSAKEDFPLRGGEWLSAIRHQWAEAV